MRAHAAVAGAAVAVGGAADGDAAVNVVVFAGRRQYLTDTDARKSQAVGPKYALGAGRDIVTVAVFDRQKDAIIGCCFDAGR